MDYFKNLDLTREPFSNSPDPHFFFHSKKHLQCMQKIEISFRLRRGLSVIIGDVGTGKTTLCRHIINKFADDKKIESHLILDPHFSSPSEFLSTVAKMFLKQESVKGTSDWQFRETIKKYLFRRGVDEGKTVVLIIDEGQKIPGFCLEILREFLNYEANDYKLLQIVIFAQEELYKTLKKYRNFTDRIDLFYTLGPLTFWETRSMIRFRLESTSKGRKTPSLFSFLALWSIYRASGGYPRAIMNICHRVILALIIQNRSKADWNTAQSCVKRFLPAQSGQRPLTRLGVLTGILVGLILFGLVTGNLKKLTMLEKELPSYTTSNIYREKIRLTAPIIKKDMNFAEAGGVLQIPQIKTVTSQDEIQSEIFQGHDKKIPVLLGQLTIKKGETVGEMIKKIYGTFTNNYLRHIAEENKQIKNLDIVKPGQVVRFPAIPVRISPSLSNLCWVQVDRKEILKDALQTLKNYVRNDLSVNMIPCWNSQEGLGFIIIYKGYFPDEITARDSLNELPISIASGAKILTKDENTIFFANPKS